MRIPVRRVVQGTYYIDRIPVPQRFPVSPAIRELLSQPTWSVRSLLPPSKTKTKTNTNTNTNTNDSKTETKTKTTASPASASAQEEGEEITLSKLHHLLNLSALPHPKTPSEESKMLQTLRDQVHFVKAIQSVDTTDIEPLITIRDESEEAIAEETITLATMIPYLELEERVGQNGTIRRRDVVRTPEEDAQERKTWMVDVADLGEGSERRRKGRFFYVRRKKEAKREKETVGNDAKTDLSGGART